MNFHEAIPDFPKAVDLLIAARSVVVFTGAGIGVASGIATFRDPNGFWKKFPPEEFANWQGLLQVALLQPSRFADFILAVMKPIAAATPNAAHQALATLQSEKSATIITQNIDRLHHDAGSNPVFEIHGNLFDIINVANGDLLRTLARSDLMEIVKTIEAAREEFWTGPSLYRAVQPIIGIDGEGIHRPNLVLFGEQLNEPDWTHAMDVVTRCDLFLSIGTSQSVHPADGLPDLAREHGANVICIDPNAGRGDVWLPGNAEDIVPELVKQAANAPETARE